MNLIYHIAVITLGLSILCYTFLAFYRRTGTAKKWMKLNDDLRDYRQTNIKLNNENMYFRSQAERLRLINQSQKKQIENADVTILTLAEEKQTLQNCLDKTTGLYHEKYYECDILRAEKVRRNSPAYSRSDKTVDKEGKIN